MIDYCCENHIFTFWDNERIRNDFPWKDKTLSYKRIITAFICQHIVYHYVGTVSRYILIVSMGIIVGLDTETDVSDWNLYLLPLLWWGLSNSIITNQLSSPRNQPLLFSSLFSPPSSNENLSNQLGICFATYYMFSSKVYPKRFLMVIPFSVSGRTLHLHIGYSVCFWEINFP